MSKPTRFTQKEKDLIQRYLIWCYKTTKESLDRIDRYFTQLEVDRFILRELRSRENSSGCDKLIGDFQKYMQDKEENVLPKKFLDQKSKTLQPDYQYLYQRFVAVEKAIDHFLGRKELQNIRYLYEQEMTRRILESKEHT